VTGTSYFEVYDNNTFKNNSVAGIYLGANTHVKIRDNNTIADNGQYGVWIDGDAVIFERQIWWNDIRRNGLGIYVDAEPSSGYFHAECNWWDDEDGPYDPNYGLPDRNNNTAGEPVSDYFHHRTDAYGGRYWYLNSPAAQDTSCS
jgi:hypothetical protein